MLDLRNMKKIIISFLIGMAVLSGCAKKTGTSTNDAAKMYFDAWMHVHHPELTPTALGAYVLSETEGEGPALGDGTDYPYVRVYYTVTDLAGNVASTNRKSVAQQIGEYDETYYYGPAVWTRSTIFAGVDESVSQMNVGGRRKVIVPGWLMTSTRYGTEAEYLANVKATTNAIYDFEIVEAIKDMAAWQTDSLKRYMEANYEEGSYEEEDEDKKGYYYVQTRAPEGDEQFKNDTTIYINYIGRLLDGKVFDTNIKDTAILHGVYSSGRTYGPSEIRYKKDDYTQISMGSSSVIDGFAYTIHQMGAFEKGSGIFVSDYGYFTSGSGNTIPPYAALRFDIEVVAKPE